MATQLRPDFAVSDERAKVLVVGSGGREHALAKALAGDPDVSKVFCAPGNPGTWKERKSQNLQTDGTKEALFPPLLEIVEGAGIDLVVVGPEDPLVKGLADYFHARGYRNVFGPTTAGAQIEADKWFSCDLMKTLDIPQARSLKCTTLDEAVWAVDEVLNEHGAVIKARGLTAGKGVSVCSSREDAIKQLPTHMSNYRQDVLIAERLVGREASVIAIANGDYASLLGVAADHKRRNDGDEGPNTGGMGAFSPVPYVSADLAQKIVDTMMTPVVQEMRMQGTPYIGFLYAGIILTEDGPKVLEYNCRMGDPEAQVILNQVDDGGLYAAMRAAVRREEIPAVKFRPGASCCVVLAVPGYPDPALVKEQKDQAISGLEHAALVPGITIYHAGTAGRNEEIVTAGGRVLGVTGQARDLLQARMWAYTAVKKISIPDGFHYRGDIAFRGSLK